MAIDPNIALGFKGVEIQNPMNAMLQVTQLQQSQMQMQAYQRERDALSKMQEAISAKGGPSDLGLAAEKSAESWNTRVKQIPGSALEGTGISTAPVVIPPRKPASVMNIPAGAIEALKAGQGSAEQFDSIFGPGSAARALGTKGK